MKNVLYCPICKKSLVKFERTYRCENRHSYDIASKGYVNLLLANQHHSEKSGDDKEMIISRVNFLNSGKYDLLKNGIKDELKDLIYSNSIINPIIVDIGCGDGYYTTYFHQQLSPTYFLSTFGIDLSKQAIIECCKRARKMNLSNIEFIIGNMNYLPIHDDIVDIIINSFSKIDEKEFARILKKDGFYIRILPGTNHLIELKKLIYDNVRLNQEKEKDLFGFKLLKEEVLSSKVQLTNQELINLFSMTPYYYKSSLKAIDKLNCFDVFDMTIEFKIMVYQKQ